MHSVHPQFDGLHGGAPIAFAPMMEEPGGRRDAPHRARGTGGRDEEGIRKNPLMELSFFTADGDAARPDRARLQPVERRPDARRRAQRCHGPVARARRRRPRAHRPATGPLHRRPVPRRPDAAVPPPDDRRPRGTPAVPGRRGPRAGRRAGGACQRAVPAADRARHPARCGSPTSDLDPPPLDLAPVSDSPRVPLFGSERIGWSTSFARAPERRPQDDLADRHAGDPGGEAHAVRRGGEHRRRRQHGDQLGQQRRRAHQHRHHPDARPGAGEPRDRPRRRRPGQRRRHRGGHRRGLRPSGPSRQRGGRPRSPTTKRTVDFAVHDFSDDPRASGA